MKRALLLLAACRDVPAVPDAPMRDAPAQKLRVATYNVRRFFDTVCASTTCGNGAYEELPTQAQFDARADEIAAAIRAMDPDAIALEEVETQACLDALLARLPDYHGVLGETGLPASVDVAVLSKRPIDQVTLHRATANLIEPDGTHTTFSRELLEVQLGDLVFFAAHFKSKADDDPARRLAEATATMQIVSARAAASPDSLVVLGGDLNDTPGSPPLQALSGLIRLADDLTEQATYVFSGSSEAIDHLLLAPNRASARVPMSSKIWVDAHANGYGGSDHRALTSELQP